VQDWNWQEGENHEVIKDLCVGKFRAGGGFIFTGACMGEHYCGEQYDPEYGGSGNRELRRG
jgi:hypothetical protein